MKVIFIFCIFFNFVISNLAYSKITKIENKSEFKTSKITSELLVKYKKKLDKKGLSQLKESTLKLNGKAVAALIEVMKSDGYPTENRWVATFLLGKIMGQKATPFIAKFSVHPDWIMRMASLKTLLALKSKKHTAVYEKALKDDSLVVRTQALENIRILKLSALAPAVWKMMYDKRNYYSNKHQTKRTELIKSIVKVTGELKYSKAKGFLLTLIQKKSYSDIFPEIDFALGQLTGKNSPPGDFSKKIAFWQKI